MDWTLQQSTEKMQAIFIYIEKEYIKHGGRNQSTYIRWVYIAIVRPKLCYGAIAWGNTTRLDTRKEALDKLNRLAATMITLVRRSTRQKWNWCLTVLLKGVSNYSPSWITWCCSTLIELCSPFLQWSPFSNSFIRAILGSLKPTISLVDYILFCFSCPFILPYHSGPFNYRLQSAWFFPVRRPGLSVQPTR